MVSVVPARTRPKIKKIREREELPGYAMKDPTNLAAQHSEIFKRVLELQKGRAKMASTRKIPPRRAAKPLSGTEHARQRKRQAEKINRKFRVMANLLRKLNATGPQQNRFIPSASRKESLDNFEKIARIRGAGSLYGEVRLRGGNAIDRVLSEKLPRQAEWVARPKVATFVRELGFKLTPDEIRLLREDRERYLNIERMRQKPKPWEKR